MKTIVTLTLAVFSVTLSSQAAFAETGAPRTTVAYADLDLSSPAGRQMLQRRVSTAVDRVCPARPEQTELARMRIYTTCRDQTLKAASGQLVAAYARHELSPAPVQLAVERR